MTRWDEEAGLLVFGAGVGGMTAALVGKLEGLDVLLCEKTEMVGGITASSAGTAWIPGTSQSRRAGVPDSVDQARMYLDSVTGARGGAAVREAFLQSGPAMIDDLEARTEVKFAAATVHPDYLGNHPGAALGGRALGPLPFDGRLLGADFARVLPPWREFMVLGGMMVGKADIPVLLGPWRSVANLRRAAGLVGRHALDRLRYRRGTRLVMGNALVARQLYSLRGAGVPIRFGTRLVELLREGGRVVGAAVEGPQGRRTIRAERGVVLATGGVARNASLRAALFPEPARALSLAPEGHTGDAVAAALAAGAALDDAMQSPGLWMPCSVLVREDGSRSVWPHIVLDRAKPGLIAVDAAGRRFCNEADSYHDVCMAMLRHDAVPAHLLADRRFVAHYGLGLVHPGTRDLSRFTRAGYLIEAPDLRTLAGLIGADPEGLEATVAAYNEDARRGIDRAFGRGESDLNRINGDPANLPNPCLRPIGPGPFYAVAIRPADLASSAGLAGDAEGRVLDASGEPIPGLYACGNDLASIFRGTYPGPGTTIGPALVFGWRAARHAAGLAAAPLPTRQEAHA